MKNHSILFYRLLGAGLEGVVGGGGVLDWLPRSPSRRLVPGNVFWRDQVSSNQDFSPDG